VYNCRTVYDVPLPLSYPMSDPLETKDSLDTLLKRLESIAKTLSEDSDTMELALKKYEEGIGLAKECMKRLDAAEQRVTELRSILEADPDDPGSPADEFFLSN